MSKLASLFLLLLVSFIYTDKVFSEVKKNDPLMQEVISYKQQHDEKPLEPKIRDDEMILGLSGLYVDEEESYENMKDDDSFNENKIVYKEELPKKSITNNYDYYITKGNAKNNKVSIIFKVDSNKNLNNLIKKIKQDNVKINLFIDGAYLEENVEKAFDLTDLNSEIYNLGYNGKYDKTMIKVTNNLIESITLKNSNLCLNESKDDNQKEICKNKKMHTITPTVINPTITELKEKLSKGLMISYDLEDYDFSNFKLMINTIESRGYEIVGLSELIKE